MFAVDMMFVWVFESQNMNINDYCSEKVTIKTAIHNCENYSMKKTFLSSIFELAVLILISAYTVFFISNEIFFGAMARNLE